MVQAVIMKARSAAPNWRLKELPRVFRAWEQASESTNSEVWVNQGKERRSNQPNIVSSADAVLAMLPDVNT